MAIANLRWPLGVVAGAAVLALVRTQPSFVEDRAIFLGVFDAVADGERLYVDVFDHKEPVFFWLGGVAYRLLGTYGPFLLEAFWLCLFVVALFSIGRARDLDPRIAAIVPLAATGFMLRPPIYLGLSTTVFGAALAASAASLLHRKRPKLAGAVFGTLMFGQILLVPLLAPTLVMVWLKWRRDIWAFAASAGATALGWSTLLLIRGEFGGYFEVLGFNRRYSSFQSVRPQWEGSSVSGHLQELWGYVSSSNALLLLLAIAVTGCALLMFSISTVGWRSTEAQAPLAALATFATTLVILSITYFWPHHLQVLGFGLALVVIENARVLSDRTRQVAPPFSVVALVLVALVAAWPSSVDAQNLANIGDRWTVAEPEAAQAVEASFAELRPTGTVQVALVNGQLQGFFPFLSERFELVCPLFHQKPWFAERLGETADCMARDADFVIWLDTPGRSNGPRSFEEIEAVLDTHFTLRIRTPLEDGLELVILESTG